MRKLIILYLLFFCNISFGQTTNQESCKIGFYLLKEYRPNLDTTKKIRADFLVNLNDLADTAFIKDTEITGFALKSDSIMYNGKLVIEKRPIFTVSVSVTERVNKLNLPLCCGRQFALVVNRQIVYTGYFWNLVSSFGCDGITAFASENRIEMLRKLPDYELAIDPNVPWQNTVLFDCLISTNRLTKN